MSSFFSEALTACLVFLPLYIFFTIIQFSMYDTIVRFRPYIRNKPYFNVAGVVVTCVKIIVVFWLSIELAKL